MPRVRNPFGRSAPPDADPTAELASPEAGGISKPAVPDIPPGRFNQSFRAFQHRNYRLFFAGQSISLVGTWMQTIAQAWLVLELTDSEVALGVVTMLQFLPITLFVLFAGVIADRVNKRRFLIGTQVLAMAQAAILAVLVITDTVELWHVYVLAFVLGISNAFDLPTRQSFAIEMVGRKDLVNAVALNSGMFNGARLVGPAVGGFLISAFGVEAVFALNAVTYVFVITSLTAMNPRELHTSERAPSTANPLTDLRDGISYALRTPATLLVIILVALVGTFGYNFTVMLPLISRYVLHEGSVALGFLTAAVGFGALCAALLLASRKRATLTQLFLGATAFSIFLAGVALSENLYLTMLLLVGLGAAGATFGTTANTSIQIATPDHLRARVVSLYMLLFAGSTPIGGLLTGFMAKQIGTQAAIGVLAAWCAVGVLAGAAYYYTHRADVARTADASRVVAAG
jgi:MFS family permease